MKLKTFVRRVVLFPFMVLMGGIPEGDPTPAAPAADPSQGDPPAPTSAPPQSDGIVLTKAEYGQLMGTIAQLQAKLETPEAPAPQAPQYETEDLDKMTGSQLVATMLNMVQSQVGQPLLNPIMTLAVKEEQREVASKYPDYKDLKTETFAEAQANSHLSLEQAYLIAKAKKTGTALPVVPVAPAAPKPPVGERLGITASSTTSSPNMSVKEAAQAALKSLQFTD